MIGKYTFKSPYHTNNKRLCFTIRSIDQLDNTAYCETVEYKGRKKEYITGAWTLDSVKKMIDSGYLRRAKDHGRI